jgi:hypothetical protein
MESAGATAKRSGSIALLDRTSRSSKGLCGIPTTMSDGAPLFRDKASAQKIAKEAVKKVYAHVGSPKDAKYVERAQRGIVYIDEIRYPKVRSKMAP